jgi:hypothetical protein
LTTAYPDTPRRTQARVVRALPRNGSNRPRCAADGLRLVTAEAHRERRDVCPSHARPSTT